MCVKVRNNYSKIEKKTTIVICENSNWNVQSAAQTHICLQPPRMLMLKKEDRATAQNHRSMAIKLKDLQINERFLTSAGVTWLKYHCLLLTKGCSEMLSTLWCILIEEKKMR